MNIFERIELFYKKAQEAALKGIQSAEEVLKQYAFELKPLLDSISSDDTFRTRMSGILQEMESGYILNKGTPEQVFNTIEDIVKQNAKQNPPKNVQEFQSLKALYGKLSEGKADSLGMEATKIQEQTGSWNASDEEKASTLYDILKSNYQTSFNLLSHDTLGKFDAMLASLEALKTDTKSDPKTRMNNLRSSILAMPDQMKDPQMGMVTVVGDKSNQRNISALKSELVSVIDKNLSQFTATASSKRLSFLRKLKK